MAYIPLILREYVDANYTTKGSELTFEELDLNQKYLGDAINALSISDTSSFDDYDPAATYEGGENYYVAYDGNIWKFIGLLDSTGITPGTDSSVWELASTGALAHQQNTDTYLNFGGPYQVSAQEIRTLLDSGVDLSGYIKLDGSSNPTTGNIKIGNGFGLYSESGTRSITSEYNPTSELYQIYYSDSDNSRFWGLNMRPELYQAIGVNDSGIVYAHTIGSNSYAYTCAGDGAAAVFDLENLTGIRNYNYPDENGEFALKTDIPAVTGVYLPLAGGVSMTGNYNLFSDATTAMQPVTFQQLQSFVTGLWDDRGSYNASTNLFPSTGGSGPAGTLLKGDIWTVSAHGTLGGIPVDNGDTVRALVDSPGQTPGNWAIGEGNLGYTPLSNVLNAGQIFVGNGSNVATGVNLTLSSTPGAFGLSSAGVLTIQDSSASTRGLLTSSDWNTFNSKVSSQWVNTGADIYYSAGGVMIGNASTPATKLSVVDTSTSLLRGISSYQYSGTGSAQWNGLASGGSVGAPVAVASGRILTNMNAWGHDGSNFINSGSIRFTAAGTILAGIVPSILELRTTNAAGVLTTGLTMGLDQKIALSTLNNGVVISTAGVLSNAAVSNTEIGYIAGLTAPIETRLSTKATIGGTDTAAATYILGTVSAFSVALRTNGIDRLTIDSSGNALLAGPTSIMNVPIIRILDLDGVTWRNAMLSTAANVLGIGTGFTGVTIAANTTVNGNMVANNSSRLSVFSMYTSFSGTGLSIASRSNSTAALQVGGYNDGSNYLTTINSASTTSPTIIRTSANTGVGGTGDITLTTGLSSGGGSRGKVNIGNDTAQTVAFFGATGSSQPTTAFTTSGTATSSYSLNFTAPTASNVASVVWQLLQILKSYGITI